MHHIVFALFCAFATLFSTVSCSGATTAVSSTVADSIFLFVGSYSPAEKEGVVVFSFNQEDGGYEYRSGLTGIATPSFLCVNKQGNRVYAVSEVGEPNASAHSLAFDSESAMLQHLNDAPTHGGAPCHIALSPTEKYLYTANYTGGSITEFLLDKDGHIGEGRTIPFVGNSVVKNRQDKPYLHATYFTPDGQFLLANDLGTDNIHAFPLQGEGDSICRNKGIDISLNPGTGPRHLCFHPNGKFAYLLGELSGEIHVLSLQAGKWNVLQTILADSLRASGSADVHCSPDGRFLYASHSLRGDGISVMRIQTDGTLQYISRQLTGIHPRNFAITPNGKFLLVACKDDNVIKIYRRNMQEGFLDDTKKRISFSQPVCLKFLP